MMPKKKKKAKKLTPAQQRAKENVEGGKKGYVTGPKGGVRKAERIGAKPPKTKAGDWASRFGRKISGSRKMANAMTPGSRAGSPDAKPKTDVDRGLEAIRRRRHGPAPSPAGTGKGKKKDKGKRK